MPHIAVHNGTTAPVLVDDGRVIGAGEFGVADSRDETVKQLLADESLRKVAVADEAEDVDPAATAALTDATDRNEAEKAAKAAKADVAAQADAEAVAGDAAPPDTGEQSAPKTSRSRGA